MNVNPTKVLDELTVFAFIYLVNLFGAFGKDYYNTYRDEHKTRIELLKVLFSALVTTFIPYTFSNYIPDERMLIGVSFISGFLSFSLIEYLSNMDKLLSTIGELKKLFK